MNFKEACEALVAGSEARSKVHGTVRVGRIVGVFLDEFGLVRVHLRPHDAAGSVFSYNPGELELLSDYEARIEAERVERARKVFAGVADGLKPRGLRVLIHKLPGGANVSPSIRGSIEAVTALGKAVVVIEPLRKMSEDVELLIYPADRLHEFMDLDAPTED